MWRELSNLFTLYYLHWRPQSARWDSQLTNEKMKTMFLSNTSKSRRPTSTFFPIKIHQFFFLIRVVLITCFAEYGEVDSKWGSQPHCMSRVTFVRAHSNWTTERVKQYRKFTCVYLREMQYICFRSHDIYLWSTHSLCSWVGQSVRSWQFLSCWPRFNIKKDIKWGRYSFGVQTSKLPHGCGPIGPNRTIKTGHRSCGKCMQLERGRKLG